MFKQQEIETNDQWNDLLKRPGLVGKNKIYFKKEKGFCRTKLPLR